MRFGVMSAPKLPRKRDGLVVKSGIPVVKGVVFVEEKNS
jgi:hypothetical protein